MAKKGKLSEAKRKELDKKMQEIALMDFELFCSLFSVDKTQAYICMQRNKGKTLEQIRLDTGLSKSTVHERCKKCSTIPNSKLSNK